MQKVHFIIGADLSKKTIDLFFHQRKTHICIANEKTGFEQLLTWINQQDIKVPELLIVMEHTGLYSLMFEKFLQQCDIRFTKVSGLAIKRSVGLVRGKSDKLDARRIADYANEKKEKLQPAPIVSEQLQRLQMLYATRERLVKHKAALLSAVKEYLNIGLTKKDIVVHSQMKLIQNFEKQITALQQAIAETMSTNEALQQNFKLLQTIKGVGKVLALATIIKTRNFNSFTNARKFACYCGTAPFENTSGTSIRGKTKVSHLADKRMKTLLDLAAKSAIQYDKELREYYLRRTSEGKPKMSTINIVRNKILYRMFAVVKRQTPFLENFTLAA